MSTLDQEVSNLTNWGSSKTLTLTLKNCTGTINGSISYRIRNDNKMMMISGGRVYISSFSRTSSNPGFTFSSSDTSLPSSGSYLIGYRGESPLEPINLNFSGKTITTNQTFSNCSGSRLTFIIFPCMFPI